MEINATISIKNSFLVCYIVLITVWSGLECSAPQKKEETTAQKLYKIIDGEPVVPYEANRIKILDFINNTQVPSIDERLFLKVREKISGRGRLAVVEEGDADLILSVEIVLFQIQPLEFNEFGVAVKKRIRIVIKATLFNNIKNTSIFTGVPIEAFDVFSEITPPITTEAMAIERLIDELAKRISLQTEEGWYTKMMTPLEKGKR